jgi:hypothetical protein
MTVAEPRPGPARQQVLVDVAADRQLEDVGYVVVPLLGADEVESLRQRQAELASDEADALAIDFTATDRSGMRATAELLAPMWEAHLGELFVDHRVIVSTFIVKQPGPGSEMVMHHETTFAADDVPTYNAWIPLVDVDVEQSNGVLRLVPGSEHLPHGLVGFNTPPLFRAYEHVFGEVSVAVGAPAGSALVYDTRMLHRSEANLSAVPRPAIASAVAPARVPLLHVVASGRRRRRIYEIDPSFFIDVHPESVVQEIEPFGPPIDEVDDPARLTPDDVAAALGLAEAPQARTVVPYDIAVGDEPPHELPGQPVEEAQLPTDDIRWGIADIVSQPPGWIDLEGTAAAVDLASLRSGGLPGSVVAQIGSLADAADRRSVLVLDPGGRAVVAIRDGQPCSVACFEAPELQAGLATASHVATFQPGVRYRPDGSGPMHLWNDGPGPLWLVVASPEPAPDEPVEASPQEGPPPLPSDRHAQAAGRPARWRRWRRWIGRRPT